MDHGIPAELRYKMIFALTSGNFAVGNSSWGECIVYSALGFTLLQALACISTSTRPGREVHAMDPGDLHRTLDTH